MSTDPADSEAHDARARHLAFQRAIPPLYLAAPKKKTAEVTKVRVGDTLASRRKRIQSQFSAAQLLCLRMEFNYFDSDASNTIDRDELRKIVNSMGGHHIHDDELRSLMDTIDEDKSGEVDWIEYLDMMLELNAGEADHAVADFMQRHPVILLVHQSKQSAEYVREMAYAAAEEAGVKVHIVQAYSAKAGLRFVRTLSPGRRISMVMCAFEMSPHDGIWFLEQLRKQCFFAPPCYFLTENGMNSKLHKPAGSENIIHLLDLEQHDLLLMIVRHCASKTKKPPKRLNHHELAMKHLEDQRHEDDEAHATKTGKRIGNGGIAYKPSRPREETIFAYTSLNRWKGSFSEVDPSTISRVLEKNGAERPRVIPVNSPRFAVAPRQPSWYKGGNAGGDSGGGKNQQQNNRSSNRSVLKEAGAAAVLASPRIVHGLDLSSHLDKLAKTGRRGRQMARGKGDKTRAYSPRGASLTGQADGTTLVDGAGSVRFEVPTLSTPLGSPRPSIADLAQHTPRNKF
jgi:hypothetical protein